MKVIKGYSMKKTLLFLTFTAVFIYSCKGNNPFYGIDKEDIKGPEISIEYPSLSQTLSGSFLLVGKARDNENDVLKVEISLDNKATWKLANGTTNWSFTVDSLSAWGATYGTFTIYVKATDTDYKKNTTTISISYTIDNTNPEIIGQIKDENDLNNDGYHNISEGDTIKYYWIFNANVKGYEIVIYNITDSTRDILVKDLPLSGLTSYSGVEINPGTPNQGIITSGISNISYGWDGAGWNVNSSKVIFQFEGENGKKYYIAVKSYDNSGNRSAAMISTAIGIDLSTPTVGTVDDPGTYSNSVGILFTWSGFNDTGSGISYYEVQTSDDGANWSPSVSVGSSTYIITSGFGTETFDDGEIVYIRVRAIDKSGNPSGWATSDGILINLSVSNVGVISDNGGADLDRDESDGNRDVIFTFPDLSDAAGYIIEVYETTTAKSDEYFKKPKNIGALSNGTNTGITSVSLTTSSGTTTFKFTGQDGKRYFIKVKAYDDAGNISSNWSVSNAILVDITKPTTGIVYDTANGFSYPGQFCNTTNLTFTWSGFSDVGSGIKYYLVASSDDGTNWSSWQNVGLSTSVTTSGYDSETFNDGETVYLKVKACDYADNCSNEVTSDGIFVDTTPPSITNMNPVDGTQRPYVRDIDVPAPRYGRIEWNNSTDTGSGIDYYEVEVIHASDKESYFVVKVRADRLSGTGSIISVQEYPASGETSCITDASISLDANGYLLFEWDQTYSGSRDNTVAVIRVYDKAGNMTQSAMADVRDVD